MKKYLLVLSMMLLSGLSSYSATEICLGVGNGDYSSTYPGGNRTPVLPWYITQDGNVLTMSATPCDYTLSLYDEDDALVYSVFVPAGTTQVVLPTTLSGTFEIRFETDTYYYGYIDL